MVPSFWFVWFNQVKSIFDIIAVIVDIGPLLNTAMYNGITSLWHCKMVHD